MDNSAESVKIYLSTPHTCPYLPDRVASSLVVDPDLDIDQTRLTLFTQSGFRRSGDIIYRPHCHDCDACVSVRVPVRDFDRAPNRTQRRIMKRNQDLRIVAVPGQFKDEHFALYLRYQRARHPDSDMCDPDPDKYQQFLVDEHSTFYEMYCGKELVAVAVRTFSTTAGLASCSRTPTSG